MKGRNKGTRVFWILVLSIISALSIYMVSAEAGIWVEPEPLHESVKAKDGTINTNDKTATSEQNEITGTGDYVGQADSNFIEIMVLDSAGNESPRVFQLDTTLKESFDSQNLKTGDRIEFTYEERVDQNPLIHTIKK